MRLRSRLLSLVVFLGLLLIAGRLSTGDYAFVTVAFWFNAGVLMLLLAVLVDQPYYTRDADVFLNAIGGAAALLSIPHADRSVVWWSFFFACAYLVLSSYWLMYTRADGQLGTRARLVNGLSTFNRAVGRPQALFSSFFLWGVIRELGADGPRSAALLIYWGLFLAFDASKVGATLDRVLYPGPTTLPGHLGKVLGMIEPGVLKVSVDHAPALVLGSRIRIRSGKSAQLVEGTVAALRVLTGMRLAQVVLDDRTGAWLGTHDGDVAKLQVELVQDGDVACDPQFVGLVEARTDILALRTRVAAPCPLEQGELLWVWLRRAESVRGYYQITGGQVDERSEGGDEASRTVVVTAQQLGVWQPATRRFEPITWVPQANELVYRASAGDFPEGHQVEAGRAVIGQVPNSNFPVHVGLSDLVTHNAAILGVTGSGKSWLAFRLIQSVARLGIKVLVLDVTRQHWEYLGGLNPRAIRSAQDVAAWMDDADSVVGIYQFANVQDSLPKATADLVSAVFTKLSAETQLQAGVDVPARVWVVLEEAHSLIPEWNQVAMEGDKQQVNRTARVLLQGRKFGLGALIISQRTANVTKTMLNQCNTVFAMQSFDQTGLDFLRNYMGEEYAQTISTLPTRHCILVGKASSSTRPIMVHVTDLANHWTTVASDTASVPDAPDDGHSGVLPNAATGLT